MNPVLLIGVLSLGVYFFKKDEIEDEITVTLQSDSFTKYDSLIRQASRAHNVPWRWIKAIGWIESDLGRDSSVRRGIDVPSDYKNSVSTDGKSYGFMQTILTTSNEVRPGTTIEMLNNPAISIDVGTRVIARNMRIFPGNLEFIVRAYNGGPGFQNTKAGVRDTPIYWAKFQQKLAKILEIQPGNEKEIG